MSGVKVLNPNSEVSRRDQALQLNLAAAKGLQEVVKTNLGPKGTYKMYALIDPQNPPIFFSFSPTHTGRLLW